MSQAETLVRIDRQGDIAVVYLAAPPANLLTPQLRVELGGVLDDLEDDAGIAALVLAADGAHFSYGLDLRELDGAIASPGVGDLAARLETFGKPVIAAISGLAAGAAFELALAATARVAQRGARIGLGDLALGLTPGAGGSQRLPRIVGAEAALDLMLGARNVPSADLPALFDAIDVDDATDAAIDLARDCVANPRPATRDRRDGFADPAAYQAAVARRRDEVETSPIPAVRDVVAAVEAAQLLPFEAGLALEEQVFVDAVASSQSRAQRHLAMAERRAANMPETPGYR
jgi:3-hydroxyacyl-CoA dehydrogenase